MAVSVVIVLVLANLAHCRSAPESPPSIPPPPPTVFQVQQCRDGCLDKHAADEFTCLQGTDCLMCWNQCTSTSDPISSDAPNIVYDEWPLNVISMVRDGYLVTTVITWPKQIQPINCLVTWEVMGGGLMGSLFTETSDVELSLWPETKYNVQVTCKNKETKHMSRSLLLTLDTKYAKDEPSAPTTTTVSAAAAAEGTINEHHVEHIDDNRIDEDFHVTSSSLLGIQVTLVNGDRLEAVLGLSLAFVVFFLLGLFLLKRRWAKVREPVDKQCLLTHEVLSPDHVRVSY